MPKSQIPSPARSESAPVTSRRYTSRSTRSVGSPARSTASGRLSTIVDQFKENNKHSFALSPLDKTFLSDNTDIDIPRRKSWWKKVENSRDVIEVLDNEKQANPINLFEELGLEVLSQEKKNYTLDMPDSSGSESISSVVVPQRRLFPQKENVPRINFGKFIVSRESLAEQNKTHAEDKLPEHAPKNLFGQTNKRSRPIFPAALLNLSPEKTLPNTTVATEVRGQVRNLFGNRQAVKRKNRFADFVVSDSEDESLDIQPKIFTFHKPDQIRRVSTASSRGNRESSPTTNITTEMELDNWNLLPSSTMVDHEIVDHLTPGKRTRLSKLSEAKKSTNRDSRNKQELSKKVDEKEKELDDEIKASEQEQNIDEEQIKSQEEEEAEAEADLDETHVEDKEQFENQDFNEEKNASQEINEDANESEKRNENVELNMSQVQDQNESQEVKDEGQNDSEVNEENDQDQEENDDEEEERESDEDQDDEQNERQELQENKINDSDAAADLDDGDADVDETHVEDDADEKQNASQEIDEEANASDELDMSQEEMEDQNESQEVNDEGQNDSEINADADLDDGDADVDETHVEDDADEEQNASQEINEDANESEKTNENDELNMSQVQDQNESQEVKDVGQNDSEINEENDQDQEENDDEEEERESDEDQDDEQNERQELQENKINDSDAAADLDDGDADVDETHVEDDADEEQNASQEIDEEANASDELDMSQEEMEDQNESQEVNDEGQNDSEINEEIDSAGVEEQEENDEEEEVCESDDNAGQDDEQNESQEIDENEINESDTQQEVEPQSEDAVNVTHDTTGRNRNKRDTKSPEAILHVMENEMDSFRVNKRNTSIRKTMLKNITLKQSLASHRESTGLSDGTKNSSAEGSGWDSHRTTRKTLRQTFGKDFTPRKSLRALVMEKSAKRQTVIDEANGKLHQANSTELPDDNMHLEYDDNEEPMESDHEVSKRMRQTTLENHFQKIKQKIMERKKKIAEEVRTALESGSQNRCADILNFRMPSKPAIKRVNKKTQSASEPKRKKLALLGIENLPQEVLEDMKYKPPKRFRPKNAAWITNRLYKFLESKLEPKYDYKARVRAEKFVEMLYNFVRDTRRLQVATPNAVIELKREMARLEIVNTHFQFYNFFNDYLPMEIIVKVVPDIVNRIPIDGDIFAPILF